MWIEGQQRLPQSRVEGIDRPVALSRRVDNLVADADFHRGFGHQPPAGAVLDDGQEVHQLERRLVVGLRAAEQHIDRRFGALKGEALVLQFLDLLKNFDGLILIDTIQAVFAGLVQDVAPSRQVRDEDSFLIPHQGRIDMLVAVLVAHDGRNVDAALVGESTASDIRLPMIVRQVGQLADVARRLGELAELLVGDAINAHLDLQIGDDGAQVGIADALTVAVHRSLDMDSAGPHRSQRVGHAQAAVVVGMHSQRHVDLPAHGLRDLLNLPRQGTTVGVTQDDDIGVTCLRRAERLQRILRVGPVAVVEVLGVVDDQLVVRLQIRQAVLDHLEILVQRGP